MSSKSDYYSINEAYKNIYMEDDQDTSGVAAGAPGASGNQVNVPTGAAGGPTGGNPSTGTNGNSGPAATALLNLQTELQKAGLGSDPTVIQHIQGLTGILKPGQ